MLSPDRWTVVIAVSLSLCPFFRLSVGLFVPFPHIYRLPSNFSSFTARHVTFCGQIPNRKMPKRYGAKITCTVYRPTVLPKTSGGFNNSAMHCMKHDSARFENMQSGRERKIQELHTIYRAYCTAKTTELKNRAGSA